MNTVSGLRSTVAFGYRAKVGHVKRRRDPQRWSLHQIGLSDVRARNRQACNGLHDPTDRGTVSSISRYATAGSCSLRLSSNSKSDSSSGRDGRWQRFLQRQTLCSGPCQPRVVAGPRTGWRSVGTSCAGGPAEQRGRRGRVLKIVGSSAVQCRK